MEPELEQALKGDLKDCTTLNEMWGVLDEYYDLDYKLGDITKKLVVIAFMKNMGAMLKATRIPEREEIEEEENADQE